MIGQTKLINLLSSNLPMSTIICGRSGSGKTTLATTVCNKLEYPYMILSNKVEELKILDEVNDSFCVYIIQNIDKGSIASKGSLLKLLEEPRQNTRIILTASVLQDVPDTIQSRCQIYSLLPYTKDELLSYCDNEDIVSICTNIGEINALTPLYEELNNFSDKVLGNINRVPLANALKIKDKFKVKATQTGYDLQLFLRVVLYKLEKDYSTNLKQIMITNKCLNYLENNSLNKQMIFNYWVLGMRDEYN